ncbi:hypothetical protein J1605_018021 [Eschrichtius robustus]|uniref:Protein EFR3 B n=1 Tax=Eschrichtius robustus TaxID=9764 RepID=A0AB34HY33_ESCRO|nr:hypothetical protein J1605_018021 [Eschrichtius robustus]
MCVGVGVCGCCGALRPRYKRLVDNIFPEDPEDGLVKTNMEKLTFYALSAPEKLDRIGAYLSERLIRDVGRHRYGYVCIAMEALDQLLMACHCQSINLFVESFLKMVAKLLESEKPNLQILGTNSVQLRLRLPFSASLPGPWEPRSTSTCCSQALPSPP